MLVDKIVSRNMRVLPALSNNFGMMGIPGTKLTAKKYHKTSSGVRKQLVELMLTREPFPHVEHMTCVHKGE